MQPIRVQYFCRRHGCMTTRRGRFVRVFRSKAGRLVLLYFDLRRNNFRHAVEYQLLRSSARTIRKPLRFRD
jgi:hypothetical protein